MESEEHYRKLERMYLSAPVNEFFRPTIRVGDGYAEIAIQARKEFHHAAHAVHGVAYFKLLDDAAFFAANSLVKDVFVLTVSLNAYLTRPIVVGEMKATGRVVHHSKRLILAEAEIVDGEGKQLARGSGSFMPSKIALTPEIGYR